MTKDEREAEVDRQYGDFAQGFAGSVPGPQQRREVDRRYGDFAQGFAGPEMRPGAQ